MWPRRRIRRGSRRRVRPTSPSPAPRRRHRPRRSRRGTSRERGDGAFDRFRREPARGVDAVTEPGDRHAPVEREERTVGVVDLRDEQAGGVRSDVDRGGPHAVRSSVGAERGGHPVAHRILAPGEPVGEVRVQALHADARVPRPRRTGEVRIDPDRSPRRVRPRSGHGRRRARRRRPRPVRHGRRRPPRAARPHATGRRRRASRWSAAACRRRGTARCGSRRGSPAASRTATVNSARGARPSSAVTRATSSGSGMRPAYATGSRRLRGR